MQKKKRFYVTTSIAYANSVPHIGFAEEALQADVLARYHRLKLGEKNIFFLSGTDEHGTKIKKTAAEKGMDPQTFVDYNSGRFQELLKALNISNDDFIRTTDKRHKIAAQKFWMKLAENKNGESDIYPKTYKGNYCVGCEAFLTEKDLVNGNCPYHLKPPEEINETNYFFRVSRYLPEIKKRIESGELEIIPEAKKHEILNLIDQAKEENMDVSFSRPKNVLDWGIQIPDIPDQVMYVWCDALTNYISALGYGDCNENSPLERGGADAPGCVEFKEFWESDDVNIIHIIGKDILRFHAMVWPAMLLSAGLRLPKRICVHGFITSGGHKMSKSLGNVIDPFDILEKYGAEPMRYFLLKEIPTTEDGDLTYKKFEEVYKADLQNGLGNLVSRVTAMIERYFDGKIPECDEKYKNEILVPKEILENFQDLEEEFKNKDLSLKSLEQRVADRILEHVKNFNLNLALADIIELANILDKYIQHYEPFKLIKENKEKTGCILFACAHTIVEIARDIEPFMPETSDKILQQFPSLSGELKSGDMVKKGEALFPRLEE